MASSAWDRQTLLDAGRSGSPLARDVPRAVRAAASAAPAAGGASAVLIFGGVVAAISGPASVSLLPLVVFPGVILGYWRLRRRAMLRAEAIIRRTRLRPLREVDAAAAGWLLRRRLALQAPPALAAATGLPRRMPPGLLAAFWLAAVTLGAHLLLDWTMWRRFVESTQSFLDLEETSGTVHDGLRWVYGASAGIAALSLGRAAVVGRLVARRVRRGGCPDCGYALAGAPAGVAPERLDGFDPGPRVCPECGSAWPLVPPARVAELG